MFQTLIPRTSHRTLDIQMQIQDRKGFPDILFGSNQEKNMKSMGLQPGFEYDIELDPYGQLSTDDFKAMSLDNRKCRLDHEIFDNSSHLIYTKANCIFDCHVNMAFTTCKCVPWDFVNKIDNSVECDIFGRTCFFNMFETLAHGSSDQNCLHCIDECDSIKYRRRITGKTNLELVKADFTTYCNKYICIDRTWRYNYFQFIHRDQMKY